MKKIHPIALNVLGIIILFGCSNQTSIRLKNGLLIEKGTIITANEKETIDIFKGYIVLEGDSILFVGKEKPILTGNYDIKDASGKYIIPGLIDSHVHIGHPIGISDLDWENNPDLVSAYFKQLPKSYLYFGYTTLIDLDLKERTKKQFNANEIKPMLYGAGRGIRNFDGYGQSLFPKSVRYKMFPNWVFDSHQVEDIPVDINPIEHTVEAAIDSILESNPVCVKAYYEDGFGGAFNWPVPSDSLLSEIVTQTHKNNLPIILHATSATAYQAGLRAGVDIFAHGLWHWEGELLDAEPTQEVHKILQEVVVKNIYVQLTTQVLKGELDDYTWELINNPELLNVLPNVHVDYLKTVEGQFAKRAITTMYDSLKPDTSVSNMTYLQFGIDKIKNIVQLSQKYGVKIIFGTDTPASEGIGNVPGFNGFLEMKSLASWGVDLDEIFIAATYRNAKAFSLDKEIGSIESSKMANLLILEKNPLEDINAYNTIDVIILKGKMIERQKVVAN